MTESDTRYVCFGAGKIGHEVIALLGGEQIDYILDNDPAKHGTTIQGIPIVAPAETAIKKSDCTVILAVGEKYQAEIKEQLDRLHIENVITFKELKAQKRREEIKERIAKRMDYIAIYHRAIGWIESNTVQDEGIICSTSLRKPYPEVSGYYIPTLLNWGYRDLAVQYAKWLCQIQKADGSWYDTEDKAPYVFDSAQIIKGLLAIREILPEVDEHIKRGCDWILGNMQEDGRLTTPTKDAWGNGRTCTELIHLYALSPLLDAGRTFQRRDYIEKAGKILDYYKKNHLDEIMNFRCLSHFYAYIMEALVDLGEIELAKEAMDKMAALQGSAGMVPAYHDAHWVCSTGLFQFALVWFRLGDIERGNKAFEYACKLQNESGGWYGSYTTDESVYEDNEYFPTGEISWANKFFLDALYYKNVAEFGRDADLFLDNIAKDDGRYVAIRQIVSECKEGKILDAGCGKGRYLKNLLEDLSEHDYFGIDLSPTVLKSVPCRKVVLKQGSLMNIPYPDQYFDVVYTCEAMEHAIDVKSALREMARVTKVGGTIAVVDKDAVALGELEISPCEQWFDVGEMKKVMSCFCDDVAVEYVCHECGKHGLFVVWHGRKR